MKKIAILALAAAAALASGSALAARVFFGVGIGVPLWGPAYYPYPYYYPPYYYEPAPVVVRQQPQRYIEQSSPDSGYWYYCADAKAYYPYVKDCPGGWQRVSPTPR
jgi:hypothetical protein